ncbi:MAG: hypothetical protein IPJ30_01665 [Acidobacteria bacterium]|nr:hypothetical protein [Acidobacteriota bacterium]
MVDREVLDQDGQAMDESTGVRIKEKLSPENPEAKRLFDAGLIVQQERSLPLTGGHSYDFVGPVGASTQTLAQIDEVSNMRAGSVIKQEITVTMPKRFLFFFKIRRTVLRQTNVFTFTKGIIGVENPVWSDY